MSVDIPPGSVCSVDSIDLDARSLDLSLGESRTPIVVGRSFHCHARARHSRVRQFETVVL